MKLLLPLFFAASLFAQGAAMNVTVSWGASPTSGVNYNVYRAPVSNAAACTSATIFTAPPIGTGLTALTFNDSNVPLANYCYKVTATLAGNESVGNPSGAAIPQALPGSPGQITIIIVVPKGQ